MGRRWGSGVTISGDTTNDGTGDVQAFTVNAGVTAVLKNLTFTKGALAYSPTPHGGAIVNNGDLTIINTFFKQGATMQAPLVTGDVDGARQHLYVNQSNNEGSAIMNFGTMTIANSTIAANSAGSHGGGI